MDKSESLRGARCSPYLRRNRYGFPVEVAQAEPLVEQGPSAWRSLKRAVALLLLLVLSVYLYSWIWS